MEEVKQSGGRYMKYTFLVILTLLHQEASNIVFMACHVSLQLCLLGVVLIIFTGQYFSVSLNILHIASCFGHQAKVPPKL